MQDEILELQVMEDDIESEDLETAPVLVHTDGSHVSILC